MDMLTIQSESVSSTERAKNIDDILRYVDRASYLAPATVDNAI